MYDDTLLQQNIGDGEEEEEDSLKKPKRLLPGVADEDEPEDRLGKLSYSKQGERSAKASRKSRAKKGLGGENNVATEMQMSNLSINGRLQPVDMMSIEPGQRQRFKSNQNRGQKNYHQKDVEFDQTQLHHDGRGQKGKIQAEPGPLIEIEEMTDERMEANKFKEFAHLFENMTVETRFITDKKQVVNVIITNDATKILALVFCDEEKYQILIYDAHKAYMIQSYDIIGTYIKANLIEQSESSKRFAVAYNDDGQIHLLIFDKQKIIVDFDVNKYFQLPYISLPLSGFYNPFAICCFLSDQEVFFSYYTVQKKAAFMHYHFIYNVDQWTTRGALQAYNYKDCTKKNFPQRCFYDCTNQVVHCFYRQGGAIKVSTKDTANFHFDRISEYDLGDMFMFRNKVLVVRSSEHILFFKLAKEDEDEDEKWLQYDSMCSRGFINGSKKLNRFTIIEDQHIHFCQFSMTDDQTDSDTFKPIRVNTMMNFFETGMLVLGDKAPYAIAYKEDEPDFKMFTRKMHQDFKATVNNKNFENALGMTIEDVNHFFVADDEKIFMFDDITYEKLYEIDLELKESDTREDIEIINMKASNDGQFVGVSVGKNRINGEEIITEVIILKRNPMNQFKEFKRIDMVKLKLTKICKRIYFDYDDSEAMIFADSSEIIQFNFVKKRKHQLFDFKNFDDQPEFFIFNPDQTICIVTTLKDTQMINLKYNKEYDLDQFFGISAIKNVLWYDSHFYILANKRDQKLGTYLIKIHELNILKDAEQASKEHMFILNLQDKLCIDDVDMYVLKDKNRRQLVVSHKTIYINTYSVIVIDILNEDVVFRHDSFNLWETKIMSFLNDATLDYVSLSERGMGVLGLSTQFLTKRVKDNNGEMHQVHSLASCDYLKLNPRNHILFSCQQKDRNVCIQGQYKNPAGETIFENIYQIKVMRSDIRDLLLLQSMYYCQTVYDIEGLVDLQGNANVFYSTYLELERRNLVSILAFDSRAIRSLLNDEHASKFDFDHPIFFPNKHPITLGNHNAMDVALENNQIRAVELIIKHIVTYQQTYTSSYLFRNNILKMFEKGIDLEELLCSEIFQYEFEDDEWPSSHNCLHKIIRPYNAALFNLRKHYDDVFPDLPPVVGKEAKNSAMYKITYKVNLLGTIAPGDQGSLVDVLAGQADLEQLGIFNSDAIRNLVEYKWDTYAKYLHFFGFGIHVIYMICIALFVHSTYMDGDRYGSFDGFGYPLAISLCIVYPFIYDTIQLIKQKHEYFYDQWNVTDFFYQYCGIVNIAFQFQSYQKMDHNNPNSSPGATPVNVILLVVVLLFAAIKTMSWLRIFKSMSLLVAMIKQAIADLVSFLIFFFIILAIFTLIMGVLGFQNYNIPQILNNDPIDPPVESEDGLFQQGGVYYSNAQQEILTNEEHPGVEYSHLPQLFRTFLAVFRMALGDNDMGALAFMIPENIATFWIVWLIISLICQIFLLNFIIAELSNSYQNVKDNYEKLVVNQQLQLIAESDDMLLSCCKNQKTQQPRYLVIRERET